MEREEMLKGIVVQPKGDEYRIYPKAEIPNELERFQRIVGGYIEIVQLGNGIVMVLNEEGKLMGLPPNIHIGHDILVGVVIFVGVEGEEFRSLTEEERRDVLEWLEGKIIE